jgi:hypothetical protein
VNQPALGLQAVLPIQAGDAGSPRCPGKESIRRKDVVRVLLAEQAADVNHSALMRSVTRHIVRRPYLVDIGRECAWLRLPQIIANCVVFTLVATRVQSHHIQVTLAQGR